jgi:hypothetical protein
LALLCIAGVIGFIFLGINFAMVMIVFFAIHNERQINLFINKEKEQEVADKMEYADVALKAGEGCVSTTSYLRSTRRTVLQALMYILAFCSNGSYFT